MRLIKLDGDHYIAGKIENRLHIVDRNLHVDVLDVRFSLSIFRRGCDGCAIMSYGPSCIDELDKFKRWLCRIFDIGNGTDGWHFMKIYEYKLKFSLFSASKMRKDLSLNLGDMMNVIKSGMREV